MLTGVGPENQPSIYGGDPPDQGLAKFGDLLEQVDAVIWSDGMFNIEEQRLFAAFMGKQKMKILAMQRQQQAAAGQQQFSPQQRTPALQEEPMTMGYGTGGNSEYVP
jgi:hypothetical protein